MAKASSTALAQALAEALAKASLRALTRALAIALASGSRQARAAALDEKKVGRIKTKSNIRQCDGLTGLTSKSQKGGQENQGMLKELGGPC